MFSTANNSNSPLPSGYRKLSYIESTGTQYINTEFTANHNTRVVCDFQFTEKPVAHWSVFGVRTGSQMTDYQYCFGYSSFFRTDYYQTRSTYDGSFNALDRHLVDKNKNITSLDGTLITQKYARFTTTYPIALFGINTSNSVSNMSKMRIYSCEIYGTDVLLRDFLPCINPDGEVGLYDLVKGKFHGNAGTEDFIAGY